MIYFSYLSLPLLYTSRHSFPDYSFPIILGKFFFPLPKYVGIFAMKDSAW